MRVGLVLCRQGSPDVSTKEPLLECVLNVSEGTDAAVLAALAAEAGAALLDLHSDSSHNRCVLTLAGDASEVQASARRVARCAVETLDLARHSGVHPRIGVLDVVPWVSLELAALPGQSSRDSKLPPLKRDRVSPWRVRDGAPDKALAARESFAVWAAESLSLPCFTYGPERQLPEVRRQAWKTLSPDYGPPIPHPTAGAAAVGARPLLVAYNLWLDSASAEVAQRLAKSLRGPYVRALGLSVAGGAQVSCNLLAPAVVSPAAVFDTVAASAALARAELVGLAPAFVLDAIERSRWAELGLSPDHTIEAGLARRGWPDPVPQHS